MNPPDVSKKFVASVKEVIPPNPGLPPNGFACYAGVSMNSSAMRGGRLIAVVRWIRTHAGSCRLVIGDTLNRFNLMLNGLTEDEAMLIAEKDGERFERKCPKLLGEDDLRAVTITRWKDLSILPRFLELREQVKEGFLKHQELQDSLDETANQFLTRWRTKLEEEKLSHKDQLLLSRRYLLEEMAGYALLVELGHRVEVYPGPEVPCLRILTEREFSGIPSALHQRINVELELHEVC